MSRMKYYREADLLLGLLPFGSSDHDTHPPLDKDPSFLVGRVRFQIDRPGSIWILHPSAVTPLSEFPHLLPPSLRRPRPSGHLLVPYSNSAISSRTFSFSWVVVVRSGDPLGGVCRNVVVNISRIRAVLDLIHPFGVGSLRPAEILGRKDHTQPVTRGVSPDPSGTNASYDS